MRLKSLCKTLCLVFFLVLSGPSAGAETDLPLNQIRLPPGFEIAVYTEDVPNARGMTWGEGVLFVGTRREGKVYAVIDENNDGKADAVKTIADNLDMPVGVAYRKGDLYTSSINRIVKLPDIVPRLDNPPEPETVNDTFPSEVGHGWKFIAFGPDDKLYVPVGAPCNICLSKDERYASIMRMNPDGTGLELFAGGVRNTVGFAWHPVTGDLWFTDNGRDWLDDNSPPDELNRAEKPGLHFGYPFCHGKNIKDPEFGHLRECADLTPAAQELGPHVAALGMRFYTGGQFPGQYRNQIFIAEHGSWNRSTKIGYRVMVVRLKDGKPVSYEPFAEGWLQGENRWGRPVDVEIAPDGSLLVSDDLRGVIYRITYRGD